MIQLAKIISGGQTGADRGGLDAAIVLGIPHGGYCPRGRRAEDGRIPLKYGLIETIGANYYARTSENVALADATFIFARNADSLERGSLLTRELAEHARKPFAVFGVFEPEVDRAVKRWLARVRPVVLNIAGNRESVTPGIQAAVRNVLIAALDNVQIIERPTKSEGLGALAAALKKAGLAP